MTDKELSIRYTSWMDGACFVLNENCGVEVECDNEDYYEHQDEVAGSWEHIYLVLNQGNKIVHVIMNNWNKEVARYTHAKLLTMVLVTISQRNLSPGSRRLRFESEGDDLFIALN